MKLRMRPDECYEWVDKGYHAICEKDLYSVFKLGQKNGIRTDEIERAMVEMVNKDDNVATFGINKTFICTKKEDN